TVSFYFEQYLGGLQSCGASLLAVHVHVKQVDLGAVNLGCKMSSKKLLPLFQLPWYQKENIFHFSFKIQSLDAAFVTNVNVPLY
uniref:Uncharacterized protein n=1 Tax=Pavo cristatus TaxID=9049 RepID=A0A8C9FYB0_PAVCR